jgi:hypothetical protein
LEQAIAMQGLPELSPYAGVMLATIILGRCLGQILPWKCKGVADMQTGEYWKIHRHLDTWISHIFINLPPRLRLSESTRDATLLFMHVNLHLIIILLHQTAIEIVTTHCLDPSIAEKSFRRCLVSSQEIKNIVFSIKDLKSYPVLYNQ